MTPSPAQQPSSTDQIRKEVVLQAPRARVWRALTDSKEFGAWFRIDFQEPFRAGAPISGRVTYPGYEHHTAVFLVEKIEPERLFSFRWHPHAVDPEVEYAKEPTTLVEFTLEEVKGGTKLTVVESGFDAIPAARRATAFKMNGDGWAIQVQNVAEYLRSRA
jgi:uncharacterized protein YndB with AHSA1/START domain